ncbi:MAG TPA: hypothetical protein PKE52_06575, partial [Bacteroidales bacterium]|nr:hypothetical protein [Bacteroidales bacterium]
SYKEDKKQGRWMFYDAAGALVREQSFNADLPHGLFTTYYPDGKMQNRGNYAYGQQHGIFTYWNSTGVKAMEVEFVNGKKVRTILQPKK